MSDNLRACPVPAISEAIMVQLTLPKNSQIRVGKTWPKPEGAKKLRSLPHLSLEPR